MTTEREIKAAIDEFFSDPFRRVPETMRDVLKAAEKAREPVYYEISSGLWFSINGTCHGHIFKRCPDGQLVSIRQLTPTSKEEIDELPSGDLHD